MSRAVFEVDSGRFAGRFVIAQWDERHALYIASMTAESKRLTGCWGVSARTLAGIAESANVQRYRSAASARRALRRIEENQS